MKSLYYTTSAAAMFAALATGAWSEEAQAYTVEIKKQELTSALQAFSNQTQIQLIYPQELVKGKVSGTIHGSMGVEEGLMRLLGDAGLSYRQTGDNTYVITETPSDGYRRISYTASAAEASYYEGNLGVYADDERKAESGAVTFDEIVVTGQKIARGIQDTQASVSIMTGNRMEQNNIISLEDALMRVSNADIDTFGNVSLRGIDKNGSGGITTNRMVLGVYVDDVSQSFQSQRFASTTWDVAQVEVLRGPVTTVQGRNALAGAIVINTADPEFDFGGKVRASYGEDNAYQVAAAVTGPIVDDVLAFRLSAEQRGGDGSVTNITLDDDEWGKYKTQNIRGKLLFRPNNNLDVLLRASYSRSDPQQTGGISITSEDPADRETLITSPDFSFGKMHDLSMKIDYTLSDKVTLTSVTAYAKGETLNVSPFDGLDIAHPERVAKGGFDDRLFSQELRALYSSDRLTALFGLYYANLKNEQQRSAVIDASNLAGPSLAGLNTEVSTPVREKIKNYAAFIDLEYNITDSLRINLGARFDDEKNDFSRALNEAEVDLGGGNIITLLPAVPASNISIHDNEFLPKAGIVYDVTPDVSLGFTWSRGYRPGGSGVNSTSVLRGAGIIPYEYDAEKTDNYEVSFRSMWLDGALILNANGYYVNWKDQQVLLRGPLSGLDDFVIANVSSSTLYGAEFEMQANLDNLSLFASLGLADSEFNEADIPQDLVDAGFVANSLEGYQFAGMSDVTASVGASYRWDFGLLLSGDVNYVSDAFYNSSNTTLLPSYTLVNLNASYATDYGTFFVYAKNVFDEVAQTGFYTVGTTPFYTLREGRNIGVGFQVEF